MGDHDVITMAVLRDVITLCLFPFLTGNVNLPFKHYKSRDIGLLIFIE